MPRRYCSPSAVTENRDSVENCDDNANTAVISFLLMPLPSPQLPVNCAAGPSAAALLQELSHEQIIMEIRRWWKGQGNDTIELTAPPLVPSLLLLPLRILLCAWIIWWTVPLSMVFEWFYKITSTTLRLLCYLSGSYVLYWTKMKRLVHRNRYIEHRNMREMMW